MFEITDPDNFRKNIINKLNGLIKKEKICINIEKGIYNYSIKEATIRTVVKKWENPYFVQLYVDRLRSVYLNLYRLDSLREQVISKKIKAHEIAFMTHQEMDNDKWAELIEEKRQREKSRFDGPKATTSSFTCYKCKGNNCTHYQLQTRSADEPMTTFVTCLTCAYRWKF
tara:strand:+ start:1662 stop:2171 length:510 start_codon:yes stop_codon:yes gene_type:complete